MIFAYKENLSVLLNNKRILEMSYREVVQSIKTQTRAVLAERNIHVNGPLGSPCAYWPVVFVDKCPFILKHLDDYERIRAEVLMKVHFSSPHVVEFLIFDIADLIVQSNYGSPPIKKSVESSRKANDGNLVMLMPVLPITVDLMPLSAFKPHVSIFITEIMNGLKSMHDVEFAHMDVKPSNIAVQSDGRFVLIDLGSTAKFGSLTSSTSVYVPKSLQNLITGTYASDPMHDYWMLAMTVYDMLNDKIIGKDTRNFDKKEVLEYFNNEILT
jgi:serine/threonine protein kinase